MDNQLLSKIEINSAKLPEVYNNAVTALKNCVEIDEVKDWTDKMAAIASYWRQTNDETMFNMAQKIRAQSYRRMGELLSEYDGRGNYSEQSKKDIGVRFTKTEIATQSGLSERETKTATRLSNIPEPEFNDLLEAEKVPTITELSKHGTKSILYKPKPEGYSKGIHVYNDFKNISSVCRQYDANFILDVLDDDYKNQMFEFFDEIINFIDTYKLNY
jgi:hypothetical protein